MAKWLGRGWKVFKGAEHAHFGDILVSAVFDWRPWAVSLLGTVMSLFITSYSDWTPGLVWLAALGGGACIAIIYIAISVFLSRRRSSPIQAETEIASGGAASIADMPIVDLFHHIQPDLLDNADDAAWERIGHEIRDAFSIRNLRVWGRPVEDRIGKILGERPTLRLIDPTYWHSAHFSWAFFDNTAGDSAHTYTERNSGLPEYTDLRVTRDEALKINWTSGARPVQQDRVTLLDFRNIARDQFEWDVSGKTNVHIMDLLFGLREAGAHGEIAFWGRRRQQVDWMTRDEVLIAIPREHWHDFEIETGNVVNGDENLRVLTYNPRNTNWMQGSFADLHLDRRAALHWLMTKAVSYKGRPRS